MKQLNSESVAVLERELDEALASYSKTIHAAPRLDVMARQLDQARARRSTRRFTLVGVAAAGTLAVAGAAAAYVARDRESTQVAAIAPTSSPSPATAPASTAAVTTTTAPTTTRDTVAPALTITSPADGSTVDQPKVKITGSTEPGASVTFADQTATAPADGHFAFDASLVEGPNRIELRSSDASGNVAVAAVTVTFAPPPPPPPPTTAKPAPSTTAKPAPPPAVAFTMSQKWFECDSFPPFEEFSGTAAPGAVISVSSPYGGGSTTADAKGKWYLKVEFPTAPKHQPFTGKVTTAQGSKSFTFKAIG